MRILHIGGYSFLTTWIAQAFRSLGHESALILPQEQTPLLTPSFSSDILSQALTAQDYASFDVHQWYPTYPCSSDAEAPRWDAAVHCRAFLYRPDCLLAALPPLHPPTLGQTGVSIGHPLSTPPTPPLDRALVIPVGINFDDIPATSLSEPEPGKLSVFQLCYPDREQECAPLIAAASALRSRRFRFQIKVFPVQEIFTLEHLFAELLRSHIYIDQLSFGMPSIVALLALALGRTVLTACPPAVRREWPHLEQSPVLDTSIESLETRLESFLREPRAIRDLHGRGQAYTRKHHTLTACARALCQQYQALAPGPVVQN